MRTIETMALRDNIIDTLRTVYDPEIPVNIYDLGLIYDIHVDETGSAYIKMTLTSPGCPVAVILPEQVRSRIVALNGIKGASVDIVWDPPWDYGMMSEGARLELGLM
jgi:FeS assembly SUF system protein